MAYFDISEMLDKVLCPKCKAYFLAAHSKVADFFEGALSACPNCKTLYVFGALGLQEASYETRDKPEDFFWTDDRCSQQRKLAVDHYRSSALSAFMRFDIVEVLEPLHDLLSFTSLNFVS